MAETASSQWRTRVEQYGVAGPIVVAAVAAVVYLAVHEVFHLVVGYGFTTDAVGSAALGAVAAAGMYVMGWNYRSIAAAFIGVFVAHTLVMGHYGAFLIGNFSGTASLTGSVTMAVVGAVVFFIAAGGFRA